MAGEYKIPPVGGSFADTIARAQAAAEATSNLDRKAKELQQTEERGTGVEQSLVTTRADVAGATEKLSAALRQNIGALNEETAAITRNVEALRAKLALVRELHGSSLGAIGGGIAPVGAAGAGAGTADVTAAQARNDALIAERQAAERAAARQAAQADALAASAFNLRASAGTGGRLSSGAEAYLSTSSITGLESLAATRVAPPAPTTQLPREPLQIAQYSSGARPPGQWVRIGYGEESPGLVPLTDQRKFAGAGQMTEAARAAQEYERRIDSMAGKVGALGERQAVANQRFTQASAAYADASSSLSRHGALTTEFLQALSRGEVTLQEFGSQVTSTIGKFGGWALAAGAVYGVYRALKDVAEGAGQTQSAVLNLGRFIPGLGGPAGGGSGQRAHAENTLRDLSTEFNVPIKEVSDAMQVMARTFHTVSDAGKATAAVLALTRLDQVPQAQSEQYLVGIGNSLGLTKGSQLVNVVNQLNAIQADYGARVSQTLPGIARAVPAAIASGTSLNQVEALTALGVRGGVSGTQIGTALLRSMTNFAFRSSSGSIFGAYGITPVPGQYGQLIEQVIHTIDSRSAKGTLTGLDLRNLAQALGGPQLGGRSILPILAQEAERPGSYDAVLRTTQHPRSYTQDLNALLGGVGEQFRRLGIDLQNFGSELASIGILTPIEAFLNATNTAAQVLQFLLRPLGAVANVFNELPGPMRDVIGLLIAYRATQAVLGTRVGGAAQNFVGRVPGLSEFGIGQDQAIVQGFAARARTFVLPALEREVENASARRLVAETELTRRSAVTESVKAENPQWADYINRGVGPPGLIATPEFRGYSERLGTAKAAEDAALAAANAAREEHAGKVGTLTQLQADTEIALGRGPGKGLSFSDRAKYLAATGNVTAEEDNQIASQVKDSRAQLLKAVQQGVGLQAEQNAIVSETLTSGRSGAVGGGRGGGGAASEALGAAAVAAIVPIGLRAAARDTAGISDLSQTVEQVRQRGAGPPLSTRDQPFVVTSGGTVLRPGAPTPDAATARELQAGFGLSGFGAGVINSAANLQDALKEKGLLSRTFGDGGFARGTSGLFLGSTALGLAGSAFAKDSAPANAFQGASSGLMAALFARFAGAGLGVQGLVGIGSQIASSFQTGGTQGGLAAVGGGAAGAGLAALGVALAPDTLGLSLIPALVGGGALGSFVGGLLGQGPSPQEQAQQNQDQALSAIGVRRGSKDPRKLLDQATRLFGHTPAGEVAFDADVWAAFAAGGQTGQSAQQRLSTEIPALQSEQYLFGAKSKQGRVAGGLLSTLIQSAVENAQYNPQQAYQAIQAAEQSREGLVQNQFKYSLSTARTPGQAQAAADTATKAYQQQLAPYQQALNDLVGGQDTAQKLLQAALASGNKKRIDAAQKALESAKTATDGARALLTQATDTKALQIQQVQQQAYQVEQQAIASRGSLEQAQAGGNQLGQLQAQLRQAQRTEQAAQSQLSKPYADRKALDNEIRGARAQGLEAQTKIAQQGLAELKGSGALSEARVFTGDPIGQARVQLNNAQQQYNYILRNRKAFDPSDINAALAALITARQSLAQTVSDYNTQMIQVRTQIAQARAYGDVVQQAAYGLQGAAQQLGAARTPAQHQAALLAQASAQSQAYQANQQRLSEQGALAQAYAAGNPVQQAQVTVQYAQKTLAAAHGIDNVLQAHAALLNAQHALAQAEEQHAIELGALAASTTPNQVQQLADQMKAARNALQIALRAGDAQGALQARTQYNQLLLQHQQTLASTRESTIQFQLDMYQITYSQAIQQLKGLLKLKDLSTQQRQQIQQEIRQLQLQGSQPGQFDLGPANAKVKLPTVYDVLRAGGFSQYQGEGAVTNPGQQTNLLHIGGGGRVNHVENTINVYVKHGADVPQVADAIDRATNSHVRARLRAAGLRGS